MLLDTNEGQKFDQDKLDYSLVVWPAIEEVIKVMTFGAKKYSPDNWQKVDGFRRRYINAAFRHLVAYALGEDKDPETGLSHMAHLACNAQFLIWKELQDENKPDS